VSRDGRTLVASSSGTAPFALTLLRDPEGPDLRARQIPPGPETEPEVLNATFMGLALSPEGATLYASGGDDGTVARFDLETGRRTGTLSLDGTLGGRRYAGSSSGDLALTADGRWLFVVDRANFRLATIDLQAGRVVAAAPVGRYPFALSLASDGRRVWVANIGMFVYQPISPGLAFPPFGFPSPEARAGVTIGGRRIAGLGDPNVPESFSVWGVDVTDPGRPRVVAKIKTGRKVGQLTPWGFPAVGGSGPCAVLAGRERLYVSNGSQDTVQAFDLAGGRPLFTTLLTLPPFDRRLRGAMPFGLALSPDERRLYVAEAGINAVGLLDARTGALLGHLPVGWWPSHVQRSPDGRRLYVACANGLGAGPNGGKGFRAGPEGTFVGRIMKGIVCLIPTPADAALPALTKRVSENNAVLGAWHLALGRDGAPCSPMTGSRRLRQAPSTKHQAPGPLAQIRHVVFIAKENRTFDEVFGDLPRVNGDPSLARFGAWATVGPHRNVAITPNHRTLARRYAISDNFYVDSDVSADGHRWLVGVYPNPWVTVNTIMSYGSRNRFQREGPPGRRAIFGSSGSLAPEDYLEAGSIWENLTRAGLSFRNYGEGFEFAGVEEGPGEKPTGALETVNIPMPKALFDNTSRIYPQFNMNIPDQYRADQFIKEFTRRYLRGGRPMPRFLFMHLPNDHSAAPRPRDGYPYRESFVADNDYALGRIVAFLSRTRYWRRMAIFVTEDDAQSGVDHVDAHRSLLLVIGPWAKRGYVSHRHTSIASIHKTVSLILGLPFLNQYDAAASDLIDCLTATPDLRPYRAVPVDRRIFDPARCKDPRDPDYRAARRRPGPVMDDPRDAEAEHRRTAPH
jgi:DNA-binding beta-propeller fold protein YncE